MGKCTVCGAKAGVGFSVCDSCAKARPVNSALGTGSPGSAGGAAPSVEASAASSGRKWTARVLLALAGLWIVVKALEVISSGGGLALARTLDVTNPSLFGIVGFISFISYFFVRPRK